MILKPQLHRWVYLFALGVVAVGLPFSKALISIGEIILTVNFLLEGRWSQRWSRIKSEPTLWFFVGFFALHLLGLLWTSELRFGLSDVRVKLPLLLFPLIIPLSPRLKKSEFLWIAAIFAASVIVTSFFSTYQWWLIRNIPGADFRSISLFNSHIRYSLMVCISYIILLNCAWNEEKQLWLRLVYVFFAIWMSVFIFILQSMTGIVVWIACSYMLLFFTLFHVRSQPVRVAGRVILVTVPLIIGIYLLLQFNAFYPDTRPDFSQLEPYSATGEAYQHDTTTLSLENGYYINLYNAHRELEREWNKRSDIDFAKGLDKQQQPLYATLMRYMTSKGLRKDSAALSTLTQSDIEAVENGIANVRFLYGNPIDNRIYTVIWEIDKMVSENRVQGHSVTQRLEFWRVGWNIFKGNWLYGVGTGDLRSEFNTMYDLLGSPLHDEFRLRAHNQFLSVAVGFGLVGVLIFLLSVVLPFLRLPTANSFLYIGFCVIIYASMLNEDTLETQAGVTLYAFFNAFFLYARPYLGARSEPRTSP